MRFLTAVALAVVMLWVPVDGVAQARSGDWGIRIEEDPFTDEKTSTITHFHTMLENINSVVLSCEGTYPPRLLVMTKVLLGSQWQGPYPERTNPEWDARAVTLTYRLGDDPHKVPHQRRHCRIEDQDPLWCIHQLPHTGHNGINPSPERNR